MNDERSQRNDSVSVAMCTYNGAAYLEQQLDSIASQTLLPCELVVCDDGSSDRTVSILESFAHSSPFPVRITLNGQRLGSTKNFEQAMRLCRGEFIALSDQDDLWSCSKLELMVGALQRDPDAGGIFTDAELIDSDSQPTGKTLWQRFGFDARKQRQFRENSEAMLLRHDVVTGATLVFRTAILGSFEEIPISWIHDGWLAWMIVLESRMLVDPRQLTQYRIHSGQQIGIGIQNIWKSMRHTRDTERARYRRIADQFEDLFHFIRNSTSPGKQCSASRVREKYQFLRRRSTLPQSLLPRTLTLVYEYPNYNRFARGVRSMRKDLFL